MKRILSRMRRAAEDYRMIEEGDRIAVGVSGGKDSLAALLAMKSLQRFYPKRFYLEAITIDMGFDNMDFSAVAALCENNGIPYHTEKSEIKQIIFDYRKEENPCSLCANLRRGAMCTAAKQRDINKIVYGHHFDDVVNTFFLSLFFEGRINCFAPVTYLERMDVTVLRPLIYVEEKDIKRFVNENRIPVVKSTCPADKNTKRQYVAELLSELDRENHGLKQRIFTAVQKSGIKGWDTMNSEGSLT